MSEIFWYFLKLGWLAFGGPIGQIGLMHLEVVERRKWISEDEFVRALNFCHLLPGPEATQLAIYVGYKKRGYWAGILAGVLFILPGYITLSVLAWIYVHYGKTPQVLGVLWGFRPVGLALLLAALVRISRAALKGIFPVLLAIAAFVSFYFARLPPRCSSPPASMRRSPRDSGSSTSRRSSSGSVSSRLAALTQCCPTSGRARSRPTGGSVTAR